MQYFFYDTETTGFFSKKKPFGDPSQPHLVQLAGMLCNEKGDILGSMNFVLEAFGFTIPAGAANVHGITTEMAQEFGVSAKVALTAFEALLEQADVVVAHNKEFDDTIMQIAWERHGFMNKFPAKGYCTMHNTTEICKLPGKFGKYKWPKLIEAYQILVDPAGFEGAHDAMVDVQACKEVFYALKERGLVTI